MTNKEIARETAEFLHRPNISEDGLREGILGAITRTQSEDKALLEWIRNNCKVIYWPTPDSYPVEHVPFAGKDSWQLILDAARTKEKAL